MSKPVMLVCLLVILIVTFQFEWRQPLVEPDAPPSTTSLKQQQISDREEAVKEKIIISQERHIQKLNEHVRSLQLQLLQCKGDNDVIVRRITRSRARELAKGVDPGEAEQAIINPGEAEQVITRSRERELAKEVHRLITMARVDPEGAEQEIFNLTTLTTEEPSDNH